MLLLLATPTSYSIVPSSVLLHFGIYSHQCYLHAQHVVFNSFTHTIGYPHRVLSPVSPFQCCMEVSLGRTWKTSVSHALRRKAIIVIDHAARSQGAICLLRSELTEMHVRGQLDEHRPLRPLLQALPLFVRHSPEPTKTTPKAIWITKNGCMFHIRGSLKRRDFEKYTLCRFSPTVVGLFTVGTFFTHNPPTAF